MVDLSEFFTGRLSKRVLTATLVQQGAPIDEARRIVDLGMHATSEAVDAMMRVSRSAGDPHEIISVLHMTIGLMKIITETHMEAVTEYLSNHRVPDDINVETFLAFMSKKFGG